MPRTRHRAHINHARYRVRLKQTDEFLKRVRGMPNRHYQRRRFFFWRALFHTIGSFFYSPRAHGLLLSFFSADPLCMARWSVVVLLIKYCGSSFEERSVQPLNVMAEVIFF